MMDAWRVGLVYVMMDKNNQSKLLNPWLKL